MSIYDEHNSSFESMANEFGGSFDELDNYESEYGSVIWPQPIIKRPTFVEKLYASILSKPKQLSSEIMSEYNENIAAIKAAEKAVEDAEAVCNTFINTPKKEEKAWSSSSKRATSEKENQRIAKEMDAAADNKQKAINHLNHLIKKGHTTRKIVEIQQEMEAEYSKKHS